MKELLQNKFMIGVMIFMLGFTFLTSSLQPNVSMTDKQEILYQD